MKLCPECMFKQRPEKAIYCNICGTALVEKKPICKTCGADLGANDLYCPVCGSKADNILGK